MSVLLSVVVLALFFGLLSVILLTSDRVSRIAVGGVEFEKKAQQEFDQVIVELLKEETEQKSARRSARTLPSGSVAHELALMRKYHALGLAQSRLSFTISLIFAGLGFAVIVFAIIATDSSKPIGEQSLPFASLVSAIIIEAVSALFFVQSNRAQKVMVEFFDRLRADRRLEESLALAERMPDSTIKARMMLVLGLGLADRPITDELMRDTMNISGDQVSSTSPGPPPSIR